MFNSVPRREKAIPADKVQEVPHKQSNDLVDADLKTSPVHNESIF